jgi:hypothetical protein
LGYTAPDHYNASRELARLNTTTTTDIQPRSSGSLEDGRSWIAALLTSVVFVAWLIGGALGIVYLLFYTAAVAIGLPLGFLLFGRRHAAGWIAGAIIGYAISAMAMWVPIALGVPEPAAFVAAWALAGGLAAAAAGRGPQALIALPPWTARDTKALILVLLLVPAVFALPYRNLGARDDAGTRYYRAYFTADFVWHTALTAELTKFSMPPRNPYLSHRPMHYYWTYFLVPAAMVELSPGTTGDVQRALKIGALGTGVLFAAAIFAAAWVAVPVALAAAVGTTLAVTAASAEGAYVVLDLLWRNASFDSLRLVNIDAITAWHFQGLRVDSLVRSMWYNPQHSMSAALGMLVFPVLAAGRAAMPLTVVLLTGVALAGSTALNPLIGAMFSLVYGATALLTAFGTSDPLRYILRASAAALPVGLALSWTGYNEMVEGAGNVVQFGVSEAAAQAPITTLLLSIGPILLPGLCALWPIWRIPRAVWAPIITLGLSILLFYFVALTVESSYVGFRAGQLMQICLAVLVARTFASLIRAGRLTAVGVGLLMLIGGAGLPTTVVDLYNAQDIANRAMGPGFRWTFTVTAAEQEAFDWIRRQTPADAVVQMNAQARHPESWSLIPTFAQRRMAAGLPISMISIPDYEHTSLMVHEVYTGVSAVEAHRVAGALGIDYLFVGPVEREDMGTAARAKFENAAYFEQVFRNSEVTIYAVR